MKTRVQISIVSTLVILVLLPTSVAAQAYPDGMIAYWKFDEGTGNIAYDSINEHHGDIYGATWTNGQVGGALSFDSRGEVVQIPHSDDWNTGAQLTVEAWFNLNHQTYWAQIVGRDGYWCDDWWRGWMLELASHSDDLTFIVLDQPIHAYSPMYTVKYGEWHHAVGVYDGSYVRLYVNGIEIGAGSPHSAPVPHSDTYGVTIGNDHRCFYFPVDGKIDEVAIYNRALTAAEIQQHYQNGLNGVGYEVQHYCVGFEPPMESGPVTARGNRALPLKAQLFDGNDNAVTDVDIAAPPVIQVIFSPSNGDPADDVTGDAYPAGWGTEGNVFEYNVGDGVWQYNLKTKNYTGPGTYTITMVSGDGSEYMVDPTCEAVFVRE